MSKKSDNFDLEKEIMLQNFYDAEAALLIGIAAADHTVPFESIHLAVKKILQLSHLIVEIESSS